MRQYDDLRVEVEFVPGTWTDITAWVDWSAGASLRVGRPTQFEQPDASTFSCTLDNTDGRFSPRQQNLRDWAGTGSTTPNPYWPNVVPRRRLRYSWIIGGTAYPQFVGYVRGWPQSYKGSSSPRVVVNAVDRLRTFGKIGMRGALEQVIRSASPSYYWPLTDASGSAIATELSGGGPLSLAGDAASPLSFGSDGPGAGNGSGVQFSPSAAGIGQVLNSQRLAVPTAGGVSLELWFNAGTVPPAWAQPDPDNPGSTGPFSQNIFELTSKARATDMFGFINGIGDSAGTGILQIYTQAVDTSSYAILTGTRNLFDGTYHHVIVTMTKAGQVKLYVDGTLQDTQSMGATLVDATLSDLVLGDSTGYRVPLGGARLQGLIGQVTVSSRVLTSTEVAARYRAGAGYLGETVNQRLVRFFAYAGLTSADYLLDASAVTLGSYGQLGQTILAGAQDMMVTEGGAAATYVRYDGKVRMINRDVRLTLTPVVTLTAPGDLDIGGYQPAFDDDNLVNSSTATRATASNSSATVQTFTEQASVDTYDLATETITSYAQSDADVLYNAQQRIAAQAYPTFRVQQVPIDLHDSETAGLGVQLATLEISNRIRITQMDPSGAPLPTVDLFAEGWSDAIGDSSYTRTLDTSPADLPPPAFTDDPVYGLAQGTALTVQSTLYLGTTTVPVLVPVGDPMFTDDPADYPLTINVGEEHIELPSPPTTSGQVQTFTGVTRAVDGTVAAVQAYGAAVDLAPMATATL